MAVDGSAPGPAPLAEPSADDKFEVALDAEGLKQRSVSGSLVTAMVQLVRMAAQFAAQLVLARLLFPQDFGLVAMAFPVIAFIQIFGDIGFGQAIVQRPVLNQPQVSALFWINVAIGVALGALVALAAPVAAFCYGEPRVTAVMLALSAMLPIAALGVHPAALLTRQMRFGVLAAHELASTLFGIAAMVAAALAGWSYWSLIAGTLATVVLNLLLNWLRCGWRPSAPRLVPSVWDDLRFGGGLTGANLATFLTTSGDTVLIGMTTGKVALGLYDRSYRLVVQPLGQVIAPISRVALPLLSRQIDDPAQYRRTFLEVFQALFLLTVPIMLVCMSNASVLIGTLLGPRWADAAPIFAWICVGGLASGIYPSAAWLFVSQARTGELARYLTIAAVLNITSYLLGALGGIVWIAALGGLVFVLVTTPLVFYGATRAGPLGARDLLLATAPVAAQTAIVYPVLLAQRLLGWVGFPQLVAATVTCVALFVLTGLFVPRQRALAGKLLCRLPGRRA